MIAQNVDESMEVVGIAPALLVSCKIIVLIRMPNDCTEHLIIVMDE